MKRVGAAYLQEEARLRGARPRVQAVLYPFDLDYGLAPGSGVFDQTAYGGEPGKVVMAAGYYAAGAWTSPVMGTFSPNLKGLVPSWEDGSGGMDCQVYLRTGASPGEVTGAPYGPLTRGVEATLAPYFQIKVAFTQTVRFWAVDSPEGADEFTAYAVDQAPDDGYESYSVDGETSGYLAGLGLDGRLTLSETEILDPGNLRVELARDFSELRVGDHALVMDNRQGQWLAGVEGSYLWGQDWPQKQLALYQGWELEGGTVAWQLVHQGVLQHLAGMTHGWQEPHRARLESQEAAVVRLRQLIGAPSAAGARRPFRRGASRARGELVQTTPASVSEPAKNGSGSATMEVLGAYRSEYPQDYQGLSVFWESGPGADLVSGDRWTFAATPPVYEYQVYGAPFETITAVYLNQEETDDRVSAAAATGLIQVTGRSAQVEARVVKDGTTHPVDIITDILEEVGLSQAMHEDSFNLARSLTPEYVIGVCFENLSAAQAIREIVKRCLYDLWVDFGEIKIRAYLGED
jgi:hypothetical protein